MAGSRLRDREVPWCTIILVTGALLCNVLVLVGNLKTASVLEDLGSSTGGWSKVGLGLARSLQHELDQVMVQVSDQLLDSLKHISVVQKALDAVVSLVGNTTDQALAQSATAVSAGLLQMGNATSPYDGLQPLIMGAVDKILVQAMQEINALLDEFLVKIKPALNQVGEWMVKFGDKIQSGIEAFSTSLDKVQKIFDQIMSQLNGGGDNEEAMLHETFTLFDVSDTGFVTIQDLRDVAEIFSVDALQGTKPEELVAKYDTNHDKQLDQKEMLNFVNDESIPNSMSTILRTYAKRLSQVAGNVASAKMRDEVAETVVQYFQLVCAKNMTKVEWISDALGNGSLPMEFTSAVMAQLCLSKDDPNVMTTADVGQIVVGEMYDLHPDTTLSAVDLMSDPEFWATNGFNPFDQADCMGVVTTWVVDAQAASNSAEAKAAAMQKGLALAQGTAHSPKAALGGSARLAGMDREVLEAMPAMARTLAEESTQQYLLQKQRQRGAARAALFSSATSKHLLRQLLAGQAATDAPNPNAERALNGGQPAAPETLTFAQWLSANATATADRFQQMCFDYSSESTSALDSIATRVQGFVKKVQSFINMMMKWATPAGIARLEKMVADFAAFALSDLVKIIEQKVEGFVNKTVPVIGNAVDGAVNQAGHDIGETVGHALGGVVAQAMKAPLADAVDKVVGNNQSGDVLAGQLSPQLGEMIGNYTGDVIGDQLAKALDSVVVKALNGATDALSTKTPSLLEMETQGAVVSGAAETLDLSKAWTTVVDTLRSLTNLIPTASSTLKFARKEVSGVATQLDSIFNAFELKGPAIFNNISKLWTILWTLYFVVLCPMTVFILYYGFWAGGFFGGPKPISDIEEIEGPRTWGDRCRVCYMSCTNCMTNFHDTQLCFWSVIILMQVVVLVIFVVSIALCILAGIKAFVTAGCAQVYLLNDETICKETVSTLRSWLSSFFVGAALEPLDGVCPDNNLMTCQMIGKKMKTSALLTTVFSFLATILSLQMLIESAVLHERARFRRMFVKQLEEDEDGA